MSGTDRLRAQSNERIDLPDFDYAVDDQLTAAFEQVGGQFFTDPSGDRAWILDGFLVDNVDGAPLGGVQVRSVLGRAVLSRRELGSVTHGIITTIGDAEKIIDISTFSNGTYGAYIRFQYVDGDNASRAFWDSASGQEFNQAIPTRRKANWSMRIELTNPGAEWLKVADVTITAGAVTALVDTRPFYFEGPVDGSYASGWSTDGGGVADDRNADRQQFGVKDLQTFTQAMRQSLEDIKGRGLRRWWDRDIGGMNIGFDANPVGGVLAVGDANFNMDGSTIAFPTFRWDTDMFVLYSRASDLLTWTGPGGTRTNQYTEGTAFLRSIQVGFSNQGVMLDDTVQVGDAEFRMDFQTANLPKIFFETTGGSSNIQFDRTANRWDFVTAGISEMSLYTAGLQVDNGFRMGFTGTPNVARAEFFNDDFFLQMNVGNPEFYFDNTGGADLIRYDRANNQWEFVTAGSNGIHIGRLNPGAANDTPVIYFDEPTDAGLYFDRTTEEYRLETEDSNGAGFYFWATASLAIMSFGGPQTTSPSRITSDTLGPTTDMIFYSGDVSNIILDNGQQVRMFAGNSSTENLLRLAKTGTTGAPLELQDGEPTTDIVTGSFSVDGNADSLCIGESTQGELHPLRKLHDHRVNLSDTANGTTAIYLAIIPPNALNPDFANHNGFVRIRSQLRIEVGVDGGGAPPSLVVDFRCGNNANGTGNTIIGGVGTTLSTGGGVGASAWFTIDMEWVVQNSGGNMTWYGGGLLAGQSFGYNLPNGSTVANFQQITNGFAAGVHANTNYLSMVVTTEDTDVDDLYAITCEIGSIGPDT